MALVSAALLLPLVSAPGTSQTAPFSVSLSYTPSASDPLLITFTATVVPGTPTLYNWSFGDHQYWNGSGPGFASPAHRYPDGGGTFLVSVLVHEGTAANSTSLTIHLVPAPLQVTVVASPSSGPAPLTVAFTALVSGGTGTYLSFAWDFGDGGHGSGLSVRYTYQTAGSYQASVNVTDSQGVSAVSTVKVQPSAASTPSVFELLAGDWPELLAGGALGAAATVLAAVVLIRRRRQGPPAGPPGPSEVPEGASSPPSAAPSPPGPEVRAEPAPPPESSAGRPPEASAPESLRISQRIVLHLAAQGRLTADEVAPVSLSQAGMAEALAIRQNALTNVLRRLLAAGVVVETVRHVRGRPRRLKVYQLTSRGEALAREIRAGRTKAPRAD